MSDFISLRVVWGELTQGVGTRVQELTPATVETLSEWFYHGWEDP